MAGWDRTKMPSKAQSQQQVTTEERGTPRQESLRERVPWSAASGQQLRTQTPTVLATNDPSLSLVLWQQHVMDIRTWALRWGCSSLLLPGPSQELKPNHKIQHSPFASQRQRDAPGTAANTKAVLQIRGRPGKKQQHYDGNA